MTPARVWKCALTAILAMVVLLPAGASASQLESGGGAPLWDIVSANLPHEHDGATVETAPKRFKAFALDRSGLASELRGAPTENTSAAREALPIIELPAPDGTLQRFEYVNSPVVEPGLAAKLPNVRTYAATGVDDPTATARFDLTPLGFHASVRSDTGTWYIDPYYHLDQSRYVSYYGRDLADTRGPFVEREAPVGADGRTGTPPQGRAPGDVVIQRIYRLALASDDTYRSYFTTPDGIDMVDAAKVVLMNRVNQLYNDDVAVRMVLVANNNLLNFDRATFAVRYPATTKCDELALAYNQAAIDELIGTANYDIGHLALGRDGGGIAGLGVVGQDGRKAEGCTGIPIPKGDFYAVDYVAHEMGHQFGGNHTFNGTQRSCSGGNRNESTSVEPGSGTSVMAYAGICGTDNLQSHSDPYFSERSIDEIATYITRNIAGATNQGTPRTTANHSPVVTSPATVSIPVRTPFTLTGSATDADSDGLIYMWEQDDAAVGAGTGLIDNVKPSGPLFRQFGFYAIEADPYTSPALGENLATAADLTRTFPDARQIADGNTNAATGRCPTASTDPTVAEINCFSEFLPPSARTLHFRLTARDRFADGGGTAHGDTTVNVVGTAPFRVTSQATPATVAGGSPATVTWDVAGTSAPPISAASVRITYSTDGGLTFPTELAASVPNSGSASVTIPDVATNEGRIRVTPVGQAFFDVTRGNLTVTSATSTAPPSASPSPTATGTVPPRDTSTPTPDPAATGTPTPTPTPGSTTSPTATSTVTTTPAITATPDSRLVRLVPRLKGTPRRLLVTAQRRVRITVTCRNLGDGTPPGRCRGTVRFRAKIGGRTRTIARRTFNVPTSGKPKAATRTLTINDKAFAVLERRLLKVRVKAVVQNARGGPAHTTKNVQLRRRR